MKDHQSFAQYIEQLARRKSIAAVFSDFLEMSVCAFSLGMQEERYLEIVRRYEKEEVNTFALALGALTLEMDNGGEGLRDIFGDFFMEHISHGHNGQFFTPEPICELMARMQGDIPDGAKVYDCACGSGRTLLAAAKINRKALFFGADVDRNCCLMSLINLCLNGLQGEVAWMNTLSNQFYGAWRVELHPVHFVPYIREIDQEECYQVLKPRSDPEDQPKVTEQLPNVVVVPQNVVQGTLF